MVTGPVHKEALARIQPDFVGQTEFLARACGLPDDAAVMCLTDPKLTVALCTNHCSLRDALKRLTPKRIVYVDENHARISSAQRRHREAAPRLRRRQSAHGRSRPLRRRGFPASSRPRCEKLREEGIALVHAPADTIFYYAVQKKAFDAVICAYHDQGLIPFKLVAFETGVNVTLGLPIIRTSPDHGTALEIAGQGQGRSSQHAGRRAAGLPAWSIAKRYTRSAKI